MGVDFRYLNSRLAGGRLLEADAWFQQSDTEGSSGDDQAFGVRLSAPNRSGLRWGLALKEIQRNFNPALGYVSRTGIRDRAVNVGYTHFISDGPLVSLFAGVDAQRIENIDGGLQTQVLALRPLELSTRARDRIYVRLLSTDEVLNQPFRIHRDPSGTSRDIVIPPGRYSFDEHLVQVSSGSYRRLAGTLTYQAGDFFSGERVNIAGNVTWRPTKHFTFKFAYDWNDIRLPQGEFVTRLVRLTTEVPFSSDLSWINFIQYDNVSENAGIDSRLHWVQRDGRDAYVVLTHNLQDMDRDNSFDATLTDLSLKVNYTIRF